MEKEKELTLREYIIGAKDTFKYILSKWKIIFPIVLFSCSIGFYVSKRKPIQFESTITFVMEETDKSSNGLASLASSFGFGGMGNSGGGLFSSSNFLDFLKSRNLIEKTLLENYSDKGDVTFAQKYAEIHHWDKGWRESKLKNVRKIKFRFGENRDNFSREKDSILGAMFNNISLNQLFVRRPNEDKPLMEIKMLNIDENFSKNFSKQLLQVVSEYYTISKTQKAKKTVAILQRQTDSVRAELNIALTGVAVETDNVFGLNPALNIKRIPSSKKQVDVEANSIILNELTKNLELSKMNLINETPLLQVVDEPILPLKKVYLGKVKAILIGGIIAFFVIVPLLLVRRFFKTIIDKKDE